MFKNEIRVKQFLKEEGRLSKSDGCVEASHINGVECLESTFVPKEPWITLKKEDASELFSSKYEYNDVTLLHMPEHLTKMYKNLNFSSCKDIESITKIQDKNDYKIVVEETKRFLSKHSIDDCEIIPHRIYFGAARLTNNTFNNRENVYIGMHLDSFERQSIENRKNARNRICINLGKESRFLLFYNISVISMARAINLPITNNLNINDIYKSYARKFPETPIYRMEVKPYEAYIASTEYIIHDGSSWGSSNPDINLVFRGRFKIKKFNFVKSLIFSKFAVK